MHHTQHTHTSFVNASLYAPPHRLYPSAQPPLDAQLDAAPTRDTQRTAEDGSRGGDSSADFDGEVAIGIVVLVAAVAAMGAACAAKSNPPAEPTSYATSSSSASDLGVVPNPAYNDLAR